MRVRRAPHRVAASPKTVVVLAVVAALGLGGCSSSADDEPAGNAAGCITDYDAGTDYFPDKSVITDAENFSLTYEKSYQVLTVDQPYPDAEPESYVLVRCGAPAPDLSGDLADAQQITVPIGSLHSGSTTHLPLITELDVLDVLTGVSDGSYVSDQQVAQRISAGEVAQYATGGTIDTEAVVVADPDVVMTGGTDDPAYAQLRDSGIAVVANAEWLEPTPLGRAEWIKVMAALTGTEASAEEVYNDIRTRYLEVQALAADTDRAEVLLGSLSQGTWYMTSGGSFMGRFLTDAGAEWPWREDTTTGSLPLNFEAVFSESSAAPTWVVANSWTSVADAVSDDERYGRLAAVQYGQLWNANKATNPRGGNDFYERGVLRPDLVLSDLVAIMHPELLPGHEFTFYQLLPA
jgi:iron complex transport system substrate-binding protein